MVIWKCTHVFKGFFFGFGEGLRRAEMLGELSIKEFVTGEENFHEQSSGFSSIIKKNNEKINMKKFFQLEVRSSIKT